MKQSIFLNEVIECHECGLMVSLPELQINEKALCPRCNHVLTIKRENVNERIFALSLTSIIFLLLSLPFEFLSISANGLENKFDLIGSFKMLFTNQYHWLAIIEIATVFVIPLIILTTFISTLLFSDLSRQAVDKIRAFNFIHKLLPWSMVEVFLVGVLISMIKIFSLADVNVGPSFIAFILFTVSITLVCLHIDKFELSKLGKALKGKKNIERHECVDDRHLSIQNTWALVITAIILYIPANLLPIMHTTTLGQDSASTIIGGVILLWEMGSYPIAIVIFIASILVPTAKILALIWLNYTVQVNKSDMKMQRIKLYRMAEFVGRWSMVDVYVVVILVSLIQMGNVMAINPGGATLAFFGVVVTTMLAAMTFNPKLIWNTATNE